MMEPTATGWACGCEQVTRYTPEGKAYSLPEEQTTCEECAAGEDGQETPIWEPDTTGQWWSTDDDGKRFKVYLFPVEQIGTFTQVAGLDGETHTTIATVGEEVI